MRAREAVYNLRVPDGQWIILRLDGRGLSTLTAQHFAKPFDPDFHHHMVQAAETVFLELDGLAAHVGSDEISLVLPPAGRSFERRQEKLLSLSASLATCTFTQAAHLRAAFDCRLLVADTPQEVARYLLWRRADVERNASASLAYWTLRADGSSPRQATTRLAHAGRGEQEQLLQAYSLDFAALPAWQRTGVCIHWETYDKPGYDPLRQVEVIARRRRSQVVEFPLSERDGTAWLLRVLVQSPDPGGEPPEVLR